MTSWKAIRTLIIGAIFVAPVSAVHATSVDFIDNIWTEGPSPPYASSVSNTIDGIKITATASGPAGTDPKLFHTTNNDGLGVRLSYEYDEIEGDERLIISFDRIVRLNEVGITDLFEETGLISNDPRGGSSDVIFTELGSFEYFQGATSLGTRNFAAEQSTGTDEVLVLAGLNLVIDRLEFFAPGIIQVGNEWQDHEFSLRHLEIAAVPVPAAFWMFGTALIGFVAMSRRTKV